MAGRRAFPYSVEAEDQAAPLPGRRKARWLDRPRRFLTLEAAGTFAAQRAAATTRRQLVRLDADLGVWTVRSRNTVVIELHTQIPDSLLAKSLDRMAREA